MISDVMRCLELLPTSLYLPFSSLNYSKPPNRMFPTSQPSHWHTHSFRRDRNSTTFVTYPTGISTYRPLHPMTGMPLPPCPNSQALFSRFEVRSTPKKVDLFRELSTDFGSAFIGLPVSRRINLFNPTKLPISLYAISSSARNFHCSFFDTRVRSTPSLLHQLYIISLLH